MLCHLSWFFVVYLMYVSTSSTEQKNSTNRRSQVLEYLSLLNTWVVEGSRASMENNLVGAAKKT